MRYITSRNIAALFMVLTMLAIGAVPAFATHTPAPIFEHPGQEERCENTNPHDNPAFSSLPGPVQSRLHDTWHADCDHV